MPKCLKKYKNKETARLYRNRGRKTNYDNGGFVKEQRQRGKDFTEEDDYWVLKMGKTDREIAQIIQRSVRAIQIRRCKIKNGLVNSVYNNVF